jgi:hypothetical protein
MATGSLSNGDGNFQELRNMWSSKAKDQDQEKPSRPISIVSRPPPVQKKSPKDSIPILKITNETATIPTIKRESSASPTHESKTLEIGLEFIEKGYNQ